MTSKFEPATVIRPAGASDTLDSFRKRRKVGRPPGIVVALAIQIVVISILEPSFLSWQNQLNVLSQSALIGIVAVAQTLVIIGGGFDLSVGAIFALGGVVAAQLADSSGVLAAFLCAVAVGCGIGLINGIIITKLRINPFIATLGTLQVVSGVSLVATNGQSIRVADESFRTFGTVALWGIRMPGLIFIGVAIVGFVVLAVSRYGRYLYAVGSSEETCRLVGINVPRMRLITYVVSGCAAALAGILFSSRIGSATADAGLGLELTVIAAVLVGGARLGGGAGSVWQTVVGVMFFGYLFNAFNLLNLPGFWQNIASGVAIISMVGIDEFSKRSESVP